MITKVKDILIEKKPVKSRQEINDLAEELWESCNGCNENDKYFWVNGFISGYNSKQYDG